MVVCKTTVSWFLKPVDGYLFSVFLQMIPWKLSKPCVIWCYTLHANEITRQYTCQTPEIAATTSESTKSKSVIERPHQALRTHLAHVSPQITSHVISQMAEGQGESFLGFKDGHPSITRAQPQDGGWPEDMCPSPCTELQPNSDLPG